MFARAFGIFCCFCFSTAAAAAAAAAALRTAGWSCSVFYFSLQLFCESYMVVDVVQNPQKSDVYEYEKKHVRCVCVFSGIIDGCVRYVLQVARVDSGWGY